MKCLNLQNIARLLEDLVKDEFVNFSEKFIITIPHVYHDTHAI